MGTELAPEEEWNHDRGLDWNLESDPARQGFQRFLKDLGSQYRSNSALWEWDYSPEGFSWIDCQDWTQSVVSYARSSPRRRVTCILNLTPVVRHGYRIGVPETGCYREILNTDSELYGGGNIGNRGEVTTEEVPFHGHKQSLCLTLPPLACVMFERQTKPTAESKKQ